MQVSDWEGIEADWAAALSAVESGGDPPRPLLVIAMPSTSEMQLTVARAYAARHFPKVDPPLWSGEAYAHKRSRIAYISPDFRWHPVALLSAGLFEHHDRQRFEIFGISTGPDDGGVMRRRLVQAFDRFVDVRKQSDEAIARMLNDLEVDIVVDLGCHTADARPGVMARRPAPVQVNFLGYPGTMGADYYDYVVADATVIPESEHRAYAELVVTLPGLSIWSPTLPARLPSAAPRVQRPAYPTAVSCFARSASTTRSRRPCSTSGHAC